MKLKTRPSRTAGKIAVPGSKSHTIRAVAFAACATSETVSTIRAPLISGDTMSAVHAAESLGAKVERCDGCWNVTGTGGRWQDPGAPIDLGNSGTSMNVFTALAATAPFPVRFDGDKSLRSRPMAPLLDALSELGVSSTSESGKPPLSVHGPLVGGDALVEGKSSQFVTALLIASPLAPNETRIRVRNLNEKPYIEMTLDWLRRQNITFSHSADLSEFRIAPNQSYHPFERTIPADFSTAAFPLLAVAVTGGEAVIHNLDFSDFQGDKAVFDYFSRMGMTIRKGKDAVSVRADRPLRGIEIDLNATPDALPAMAVAAAFAEGKTVLYNVAQARIKETDRIRCMTTELRKMGVKVEEMPDGMTIEGGSPRGAPVEGYDDHRIVMALAIAGLAASGETMVEGAAAAAVTYPDFVKDMRHLGADISEIP